MGPWYNKKDEYTERNPEMTSFDELKRLYPRLFNSEELPAEFAARTPGRPNGPLPNTDFLFQSVDFTTISAPPTDNNTGPMVRSAPPMVFGRDGFFAKSWWTDDESFPKAAKWNGIPIVPPEASGGTGEDWRLFSPIEFAESLEDSMSPAASRDTGEVLPTTTPIQAAKSPQYPRSLSETGNTGDNLPPLDFPQAAESQEDPMFSSRNGTAGEDPPLECSPEAMESSDPPRSPSTSECASSEDVPLITLMQAANASNIPGDPSRSEYTGEDVPPTNQTQAPESPNSSEDASGSDEDVPPTIRTQAKESPKSSEDASESEYAPSVVSPEDSEYTSEGVPTASPPEASRSPEPPRTQSGDGNTVQHSAASPLQAAVPPETPDGASGSEYDPSDVSDDATSEDSWGSN